MSMTNQNFDEEVVTQADQLKLYIFTVKANKIHLFQELVDRYKKVFMRTGNKKHCKISKGGPELILSCCQVAEWPR